MRRGLSNLCIFLLVCLVCAWPFAGKAGNEKGRKQGDVPPPVIQSPVEGAQYGEKTLECKWLRVAGAGRYHLQVAEDPAFAVLQDDRKDIHGESYIFYNFGFKSYYLRICSIGENGQEGEWSARIKFIMVPASR
jgi:hypothetical protein